MEQTAALRAEWFAQLADAIDGAQRLAWHLGGRQSTSIEARALYARLEEARLELDSLRGLGQPPAVEIAREWLERLGWGRARIDLDPTP